MMKKFHLFTINILTKILFFIKIRAKNIIDGYERVLNAKDNFE